MSGVSTRTVPMLSKIRVSGTTFPVLRFGFLIIGLYELVSSCALYACRACGLQSNVSRLIRSILPSINTIFLEYPICFRLRGRVKCGRRDQLMWSASDFLLLKLEHNIASKRNSWISRCLDKSQSLSRRFSAFFLLILLKLKHFCVLWFGLFFIMR